MRQEFRSSGVAGVAGVAGFWILDSGFWRLETGDWRLETGDWRLGLRENGCEIKLLYQDFLRVLFIG
jgi:hypothetical protein